MSDQTGSYPPDEPVIGANFPPTPPPALPGQGPRYIGAPDETFEEPEPALDDGWDDEPDEDYEDDEYYDDEYDEETPARSPMFYVFVGLVALIGGLVIFLLFTLFNPSSEATKSEPGFNVQIDDPANNARVEMGKTQEIAVSATSNEPIAGFELLVDGKLSDKIQVTSTPVDKGYRAGGVMHAQFDQRRGYTVAVKVISSSGATKTSAPIKLIAIEGVGDRPTRIVGKVTSDVNVRTGPGENFEAVKTLKAGEEVTIIGKTANREWLLIELDGQQRWLKRSAVQPADSLDLVRTTEPTPIPRPTPTNTAFPSPLPSASASPSRSPSPSATSPDFVPTNAILIDGGAKLRVTLSNQSTNNYNGPLVVSVSGVNPGTLTQAFAVSIPAGGSTTVDFELNPAVTAGGKTAQVKVDPDNAIKELNEDNNSASFGLQPPVEQPQLSVQATVVGATLSVTITNTGGPLATTAATIKVTLGNQSTTLSTSLAINKGSSQVISGVSRPAGSGTATVEVIVGTQTLATTTIQLE